MKCGDALNAGFAKLQKIFGLVRGRFAISLRGRYTRALEGEMARLRAENRALINSILGLAGIPPMHPEMRSRAVGATLGSPGRGKPRPYDRAAKLEAAFNAAQPGSEPPLSTRRRSWRQIGRMREMADARAARREREADTENFPPSNHVVPRVR